MAASTAGSCARVAVCVGHVPSTALQCKCERVKGVSDAAARFGRISSSFVSSSRNSAGSARQDLCLSASLFALKLATTQDHSRLSCSSRPVIMAAAAASIQFIRGVDEQTVPDVRLTRSRDGTSGTATFVFEQPSVFDSSRELGDITGFYMIDEEGIMQSVEVSAKFVNGKPAGIEARYVMRTARDWDRFMRFMERYAAENNLGFVKN
eukprot:TRINITY_DN7743_c0_g2_i1.p1 TRINITY_DN7743_c0_g2~~TRINITY_DN7743_c0_g2_i1.p1  ORF type:complete len:219 (-),score=63.71 TRINITY_DN7743_c0_g2_i1:194-817(-)